MLKKFLLKTVMYGVIMLGLSSYAGYLMTGQMPSFLGKFKNPLSAQSSNSAQPSWSNIGALEHKTASGKGDYEVVQGGKTVIYKWRDANGHWQYGERAPMNAAATKMEVATPSPVENKKEFAAKNSAPDPNDNSARAAAANPQMINPYSPDGVKQLMDKAHDVQRMMNEHNNQLGAE